MGQAIMSTLSLDLQDDQVERIQQVASFADAYIREHLSAWDPASLRTNWWDALRFWFGHSFYQGRSDAVSSMFEQRAIGVIEEALGSTELHALRTLTRDGLVEGGSFDERLKTASVPKRLDRLMVMASLTFASSLPDGNIIAYSLARITAGEMDDHFDEFDALPSIGEKVASFYLRDLDFLFDLAEYIPEGGHLLMQPIDTWVAQLAVRMGIIATKENTPGNRRRIVKACRQAGVDPNRFNVGAWWVGTQRIEIR
jgi:hypothetical protein